MNIPYHIAVPKPCEEDWQTMQSEVCGRFCAACQKTALDFTGFSDEDFIRYFQKNKTTGCGRFTSHQFSMVLPGTGGAFITDRTGSAISRLLLLGLLALSGRGPAAAQPPDTGITYTQPTAAAIEITGTVCDKLGTPVEGATVKIKGSTRGTITDLDGRFALKIKMQAYTLIVDSWGMLRKEVVFAHPEQSVIIQLEKDPNPLQSLITPAYDAPEEYRFTTGIDPSANQKLTITTGSYGPAPVIPVAAGPSAPYLMIVNGKPFHGKLSDLDPFKIQKVALLKDEAARARYGENGKNGVLLIMTQKPRKPFWKRVCSPFRKKD